MENNSNNKIILEMDETTVHKQKKDSMRLLLFSIGNEIYGVDVHSLKEVVQVPQITSVPNVPRFVNGVFNLRGKIVALLDIRSFFGIEKSGSLKDARVIIVDYKGSNVGILVDGINDTVDIEKDLIQPVLPTIRKELADYTVGHAEFSGNIIIILALEKVLKCDIIEKLRGGSL
jgi:purine-binding chemotaxis protein CheW